MIDRLLELVMDQERLNKGNGITKDGNDGVVETCFAEPISSLW
jgi:hypothetical protein